MKKRMIRALNRLPREQKQVLVLKYHEGLSFGEISAVLSMGEPRILELHAAAIASVRDGLSAGGQH